MVSLDRSHKSGQGGYTLVEILVAATIFVTVIGIGTATFGATGGLQSKAKIMHDTNQAARFAMETIVRDVRNADGYTTFAGITQQTHPTGKDVRTYAFALPYASTEEQEESTQLETRFRDFDTASVDQAAGSDRLAIFKRGTGMCDDYVLRIEYYIGANSKGKPTIKQHTYYVNPANNDPREPGGEVSDVDNCASKKSTSDLLPESMELGSLDFSGIYPWRYSDSAVGGFKRQPYVNIAMAVQTVDYDQTEYGAERAKVELRTSVTSRLNGLKYGDPEKSRE